MDTTATSTDADIPADIAATLVDPAAYADHRIHDSYRWLRANNPLGIARPEKFDPFWVVTRHAAHPGHQPPERAVPQCRPPDHADQPGGGRARPQDHRRAQSGALAGADGCARSSEIPRVDAGLVHAGQSRKVRGARARDRARHRAAHARQGWRLRFRRGRRPRLPPARHHGNSRRAREGRAAHAQADAGAVRSAGPRHGADREQLHGGAVLRDDAVGGGRFRRLFPRHHRGPAPQPARRSRHRHCQRQRSTATTCRITTRPAIT